MAGQTFFYGLAVLGAIGYVACTAGIMSYLHRRGVRTSIWLIRLHFPRYMNTYRKLTREETGRTGPLFGLWFLSLGLMAASALLGACLPRIR
jgi:hypothetical protein